jgi:hypothetical protein
MRPRRWGNLLLGFGFALALLAALTFVAYAADTYRTGIAGFRFGKVDRVREPGWFPNVANVLES